MLVDIGAFIGYVVGAVGVINIGVGIWRNHRADNRAEGEQDGSLRTDTQYIKRRVDDVLLEQRDTNKTLTALGERVTRVEESAKSAHHRLDGLERRMDGGKEGE